MSIDSTIEKLLFMEKGERRSVMRRAYNKYTKLISDIAHDIYKSCIQDFYSQYEPVKYERHGYPEGKNLYQADAIEWSESNLRIKLAAEQLWKYGGREDKRDKVLKAVINGKRGTKIRKKGTESKAGPNLDWPQPWDTTYPNKFSDLFQWDGVQNPTTMKEIMDYFLDNVMEETEYIYWEYVDELI